LSRIVFKDREEADVIDQFTTVVKNHYVQVKKSQSDKYIQLDEESMEQSSSRFVRSWTTLKSFEGEREGERVKHRKRIKRGRKTPRGRGIES
jgi:hypothetical protein